MCCLLQWIRQKLHYVPTIYAVGLQDMQCLTKRMVEDPNFISPRGNGEFRTIDGRTLTEVDDDFYPHCDSAVRHVIGYCKFHRANLINVYLAPGSA